MIKRILLSFGIFIGVVIFFLYVTTKISDSHAVAVNYILKKETFNRSAGNINHIFLVSLSMQIRPDFDSCSSFTYFVISDNDNKFVRIFLRKLDYKGVWEVVNVPEGFISNARC